MGLVVTKEIVRSYFPDGFICRRWFIGSGFWVFPGEWMRVTITDSNISKLRGGSSDIYAACTLFAKDVLGWEVLKFSVTHEAQITDTMMWVMHAQAIGLDVQVEQEGSLFGKRLPPMAPLGTSHGRAGIAKRSMLAAAGLTGGRPGVGLRLGEDDAGNVIRYAGPSCVAIIGPQRRGKMTTIGLTMIVEALGFRSFVILDPKGELLAIAQRACKERGNMRVLCPFKEGLPPELALFADQTDSYNVFDLLKPESDSFVKDCETLAEIIIAPDTTGESANSGFFSESAQGTVAGVIMQLKLNYPEEADLCSMASIICSDRLFAFAATAMKTGNQYVRDRLSTFGASDAPLMKGGINDILRELRRQLKWLSDPAMAHIFKTPPKPWRFDDLKRGAKPTTVFIVVPAKYIASSRRLFRVVLGAAVLELQSTVTCVADEFPMLGRVPIFETVFSEGAGHGFTIVPIIQNVGQMIAAYGREGYRNLLSGCEIQIFLGPRDFETAEEISKLAGRRTVITCSTSHGQNGHSNTSFPEIGQNVLDPHDVMALRSDQMVIAAPGLVKDIIIARRRGYWEYPEIAAVCEPNPYYRPSGGDHAQEMDQPRDADPLPTT